MIKVTPVDSGLSPDMAAAIDSFITANIGEIQPADKAWAVYAQYEDAVRVLGFATCNLGKRMADVPVYHVLEGETRPQKVESMRAHEALFTRVTGFIADAVGSGTQLFFYISPEMQDHWKSFRDRVGLRNAERFVMEV